MKSPNQNKLIIENEWKSDIVNWDKLTKDTALLMLNQSETLLKETIETAKLISSKANSLITILITAASTLLAYILTNINKNDKNAMLLGTAFLSFLVIALSIIFCAKTLLIIQ